MLEEQDKSPEVVEMYSQLSSPKQVGFRLFKRPRRRREDMELRERLSIIVMLAVNKY